MDKVFIIHFAFEQSNHYDLHFRKMIELFFGVETTNTVFNILHKNADGLDNLMALDKSIHWMFDNNTTTLSLLVFDIKLILVLSNDLSSY